MRHRSAALVLLAATLVATASTSRAAAADPPGSNGWQGYFGGSFGEPAPVAVGDDLFVFLNNSATHGPAVVEVTGGDLGNGDGFALDLGGVVDELRSAAHTGRGTAMAFGIGLDESIWYQEVQPGPSASGWRSLGGRFVGAPALAMGAGDDRLHVVGIGRDGAAWHTSAGADGVFDPWASFGGIVTSDASISASPHADGVTVVGRGRDNGLWAGSVGSGGWTGWTGLGGRVTTNPWLATDASGAYAMVGGVDGALHARRQTSTGGWTPWRSYGGLLERSPAAYVGADGIVAALVVGVDRAAYLRPMTPDGTGTYTRLGGLFRSDLRGASTPDSDTVWGLGDNGEPFFTRF